LFLGGVFLIAAGFSFFGAVLLGFAAALRGFLAFMVVGAGQTGEEGGSGAKGEEETEGFHKGTMVG
jgi:hypothetical protein